MTDGKPQQTKPPTGEDQESMVEGVDFYYEGPYMVLTAHYLKKRGFCCGSGCRHCPYDTKKGDGG